MAEVRACHAGEIVAQLELLVEDADADTDADTGANTIDDLPPYAPFPDDEFDAPPSRRTSTAETLWPEARATTTGGAPMTARPNAGDAARALRPTATRIEAAAIERWAGPDALGRWLLVAPDAGAPLPVAWADAPRVRVRAGDPPPDELVAAWHERHRIVVEIEAGSDPASRAELDAADAWIETRLPWELPATFEPPGERLAHLLRSNSIDARDPSSLQFAPLDLAVAAGARLDPDADSNVEGGDGDVTRPDGTRVWLDGGPLRRFSPDATSGIGVVPRIHLERGRLDPLDGRVAPTAELAPDQLAAVAHEAAAARIIAPAGSGKTRVLTERARHLLGDWGIDRSTLCLVAYNRRAADEIRSRTPDLPGLEIRTLNALGLAILRGTGAYRRRADVAVIDERQVRAHLDELVQVPRRTNTDPFQPWLDALSAVRLGLRDPAEVEAAFNGDVDGLVDVVPRYRDLLARRGQVDFDEQIVGAIEVVLRDPDARETARRSCRVLLVDEFQDLTPAHLLMLRLLAGPDLGVFGVGDDDQTIYGYAGATPEWLIGYAKLFPGSGDHPLTVNYRCPAPVVTAADNLLGRNRRRVAKQIHAAPSATTDASTLRVLPA